jgi:hypothetical protein
VPRGRIKIDAGGTPPDPGWKTDPEGTLRRIAEEEGARYIEGSLIWTHGGKYAEALLETVEATPDDPGTNFHALGRRLSTVELCLYIDTETYLRWRDSGA